MNPYNSGQPNSPGVIGVHLFDGTVGIDRSSDDPTFVDYLAGDHFRPIRGKGIPAFKTFFF